jgi:hypothetical protein
MPICSPPERIPMRDNTNPRDAAIVAFQRRQANAVQTSSERTRAEQEEACRQEANFTAWSTCAFGEISAGVMRLGDDFARRGSPFVISLRPSGRPGTATYVVHISGSPHCEATLTFALHADGLVRSETDARGISQPEGVAVESVTSEWAEQAAEQVMFAVLGGQQKSGRKP